MRISKVIPWSTVSPVNDDETTTDSFTKSRKTLEEVIESKIGDCLKTVNPSVEGILLVIPDEIFLGYEDNSDLKPINSRFDRQEADNYTPKQK
jgi:hypothetical protein